MSNRLASENSPYLLQHANNPVDWFPWGTEALEKARQEDKPIFLSIGYAACHWCHVMAHESFEDPDTAGIMNRFFINIKVDREERPDLDSIYMNAVVALTGQGGWPMSVFLTPEGQPFYGGTYFPPVRRFNLPSFQEILQTIAQIWQGDRARLLEAGSKLTEQLQDSTKYEDSSQSLQSDTINRAAFSLAQSYDWTNGGWGRAPKFPQSMAIEFLLQKATGDNQASSDRLALDMATHALRAMSKGGMYDVLGGGFARYSTDDHWRVPHFEKMLYDNAQLAQVYLHAHLMTGAQEFKRVCQETLDFVLREMTNPQGGFYSSLDADSEGNEGKYYLWSLDEIRQVISDPDEVSFFFRAYALSESGNLEGYNVLQRALADEELAQEYRLTIEEVTARLSRLHKLLFAEREKRVRPSTDDKVLVSWNALMLTTFAQAARILKRADYLDAAIRNARFLLTELHPKDRLLRSWRENQPRHNAYLEDYASLVIGLLDLYQSDPNPEWFNSALHLTEEMIDHYADPSGGFFDTRDDHESLLLRPKDLQDNATPSGNALTAEALLKMTSYTGRGEWREIAEGMLAMIQSAAARYPTAFARWLSVTYLATAQVHEVAILGEPADPRTQALVDTLWGVYRPYCVVAISAQPPPAGSPPLLDNRPMVNDRPTAYVCQNFICRQPVNEPDELKMILEGKP
jgi:uncharacterized protein YyaL (SSP411 family)